MQNLSSLKQKINSLRDELLNLPFEERAELMGQLTQGATTKNLLTQNGNKIVLYNSIHDLNFQRSHAFTKYMGMDADIGGDMQAVAKHYEKLFMFSNNPKEMKVELQKEAYNLYFFWFLVLENFNPQYLSFACMVHSIDGKEYNDITEDGLIETVKAVSYTGLTAGEMGDWLENVKKNLKKSVNFAFQSDLPA